MTAVPLSSMVCTRLKIVRGLSHAIYGKSHKSPRLDGFRMNPNEPEWSFGCLIGGRRGHNLDTAS
jgi:hypothetical protein